MKFVGNKCRRYKHEDEIPKQARDDKKDLIVSPFTLRPIPPHPITQSPHPSFLSQVPQFILENPDQGDGRGLGPENPLAQFYRDKPFLPGKAHFLL
jgi:hypothetical protein